jgi:1,2-phenylacetyl-CoA epoxidase catalytic subunit
MTTVIDAEIEQTDDELRIDHLPQIEAINIDIAEPLQDVDLLAGPRTFKAKDDLPEEYKELLVKLVYNHAEILASKPYREMIYEQWETARREAPSHADLVMMARFQYEELNHGYIFSKILDGIGADVGDFELRQYIFEEPKQDWLTLALHHFLASKVGVLQISEWIESSYEPIARVAPSVLREERGHAGMGYRHLREICQDADGRAAAQSELNRWWPMSLDMFGRSDSTRNARYRAWGLKKHTNQQLRDAFISDTIPQLEAIGLDVPDNTAGRRYL